MNRCHAADGTRSSWLRELAQRSTQRPQVDASWRAGYPSEIAATRLEASESLKRPSTSASSAQPNASRPHHLPLHCHIRHRTRHSWPAASHRCLPCPSAHLSLFYYYSMLALGPWLAFMTLRTCRLQQGHCCRNAGFMATRIHGAVVFCYNQRPC